MDAGIGWLALLELGAGFLGVGVPPVGVGGLGGVVLQV